MKINFSIKFKINKIWINKITKILIISKIYFQKIKIIKNNKINKI